MDTCIDIFTASSTHIQKLIEFGKIYYQEDHPILKENFLRWFYLENPSGPAMLVVAQEENEWIGLIALIPIALTAANQTQKACFAVNVLTHPSHRGKNLFVKMIVRAKEFLKSESIWLIGHPNENAFPGWKRQKMKFYPPLLPFIVKPLLPFSGLKILPIHSVKQLQEITSNFWNEIKVSDGVGIEYSFKFIAWRFLDSPYRKYRIDAIYRGKKFLGLKISRKYKGIINILIDYIGPVESLKEVIRCGYRPTILMHSGEGAIQSTICKSTWILPIKKNLKFFMSNWESLDIVDASRITLTSSDF